ncbi:MAG: metallophosphoesterase [Firmicutes bacterium]|nr:metallophosphoesterase [Bacillota bacterium]
MNHQSELTTFAIITDPHLGLDESENGWKMHQHGEVLLRGHLRLALEGGAEFVLMPGDLTKDSEPWNHMAARQILSEQPLPVFVLPGNHDVRKSELPAEANWGIAKFAPFYQGFGPTGTHPYYSLDLKPSLRLIAINTADTPDESLVDTWGGRVDDEQLAWLDTELAASRGKRCIVMIHHNLLPHSRDDHEGTFWGHFLLQNRNDVLSILERHDVQLAFSGHHHVNNIARHGDLYEITTAGATTYPCSHRFVTLGPDFVQTRTVNFPDEQVVSVALRELTEGPFHMPTGDRQELAAVFHGRPEGRDAKLALRRI